MDRASWLALELRGGRASRCAHALRHHGQRSELQPRLGAAPLVVTQNVRRLRRNGERKSSSRGRVDVTLVDQLDAGFGPLLRGAAENVRDLCSGGVVGIGFGSSGDGERSEQLDLTVGGTLPSRIKRARFDELLGSSDTPLGVLDGDLARPFGELRRLVGEPLKVGGIAVRRGEQLADPELAPDDAALPRGLDDRDTGSSSRQLNGDCLNLEETFGVGDATREARRSLFDGADAANANGTVGVLDAEGCSAAAVRQQGRARSRLSSHRA